VLLAQKAIEEGHAVFELLVDNEVAKENIYRLAKKSGMSAETHKEGNDMVISVAK
jgi:TusA-related sulfurtransferase